MSAAPGTAGLPVCEVLSSMTGRTVVTGAEATRQSGARLDEPAVQV
jgi:hypothetical protein